MGWFTKHEVLGRVEISFESGAWSVATTLSPTWYAIAFLHFLERCLNNSDRDNADLFVRGMVHNLGRALDASRDGESLTEHQVRGVFEGFRERTPLSASIKASAELARRRDDRMPLGYNYFALTQYRPLALVQPDMLGTLVPFFDRLFTLPHGASQFAIKALAIQLVLYVRRGPPTLSTLGQVPNVAMYEALKDTYGDAQKAIAGFVELTSAT